MFCCWFFGVGVGVGVGVSVSSGGDGGGIGGVSSGDDDGGSGGGGVGGVGGDGGVAVYLFHVSHGLMLVGVVVVAREGAMVVLAGIAVLGGCVLCASHWLMLVEVVTVVVVVVEVVGVLVVLAGVMVVALEMLVVVFSYFRGLDNSSTRVPPHVSTTYLRALTNRTSSSPPQRTHECLPLFVSPPFRLWHQQTDKLTGGKA